MTQQDRYDHWARGESRHIRERHKVLVKRPDMHTLTKAQALEIQAKQLDHYAAAYGDEIRAHVAAITHPELLDDEPHPVWEINRYIPRGGDIERILIAMGVKRQ